MLFGALFVYLHDVSFHLAGSCNVLVAFPTLRHIFSPRDSAWEAVPGTSDPITAPSTYYVPLGTNKEVVDALSISGSILRGYGLSPMIGVLCGSGRAFL